MPADLDYDAIRAIAVPSRMKLLEAVEDGATPSQLADRVDRHKSTVVEHLGVLVDAGLVEKDELPERRRTEYRLTRTGEKVVSASPVRLVLSAGALLGGTGAALLARPLWWPSREATHQAAIGTMDTAGKAAETASGGSGLALDPVQLLGALLLLTGLLLAGLFLRD